MVSNPTISNGRGYWDPKRFPNVSKFASLSREAQNRITQTEREKGTREAMAQLDKELENQSSRTAPHPMVNQRGSNVTSASASRGLPRNPEALTTEEKAFIAQVEQDVGITVSQILSGWLRVVILDTTGISEHERIQIRAIARERKYNLHKDF